MKHIKTFKMHEDVKGNIKGNYSTKEMDKFVRSIADIAQLDDDNYITVPSSSGSSVTCTTGSDLIGYWEDAIVMHGKDASTTWYVWIANVGGTVNKPVELAPRRYDIKSILNIIKKYPDSLRRISISYDNLSHKAQSVIIGDSYSNRKWSGD